MSTDGKRQTDRGALGDMGGNEKTQGNTRENTGRAAAMAVRWSSGSLPRRQAPPKGLTINVCGK